MQQTYGCNLLPLYHAVKFIMNTTGSTCRGVRQNHHKNSIQMHWAYPSLCRLDEFQITLLHNEQNCASCACKQTEN
jgi:hypothetical protein